MLYGLGILIVEGVITAEMLAPVLLPMLAVLLFVCMLPSSKGAAK